MGPKAPLYDVDNWRRLGRGRVLQFFATDDEVQQWLVTMLPLEYEPYTLVGTDSVEIEKKKYIQKGFEFGIDELRKAMYEWDETRWNFWIRSKVITPELEFSKERMISWVLSFNGLINLQHGGYIKNMGLDASSIGIVDQVRNDETGEEIKHKEYLSIFKKLKREINKHLCYSSFWKFKNGSEREDTKLQLMTQGVVDQYNQGVKFKNRPGKKIK